MLNTNDHVETRTTDVRHQISNSTMIRRIMENYILIWLDDHIDESSEKFRHSYAQLQSIIPSIDVYTDSTTCVESLASITNAKIFIIIAGHLFDTCIAAIHDLPLLDSIYIHTENTAAYQKYKDDWFKVRAIFDQLPLIYDFLQENTRLCDHNSVSVSFLPPKQQTSLAQNRIQIDPTFLYTQLLKETLLTIDFDDVRFVNDFVDYCRNRFRDNASEMKKIEMFKNEYHDHTPIWWYTYECSFLYRTLNKALGHLEVDTLLKMAFYIQGLHRHIVRLCEEQQLCDNSESAVSFVYRGQGLSKDDFEKLRSTEGGLMSFNNFLSTSQEQKVAMDFIQRVRQKPDKVPVLFVIKIDRSVDRQSSSSFARVDGLSCFEDEREILFSMNSVFRIDEIQEIDGENKGLWQVKLTLATSDSDPEYAALIHQLREENTGTTGWTRLGQLLIKLSKYDRAAELYMALIETTSDEKWLASYYYMLGLIYFAQGKYQEALFLYSQSLTVFQKNPSENLTDLASTFNNIGLIYSTIGDYSSALSFFEQAIEIKETLFSSNRLNLTSTYNNIGLVHFNMGEHERALTFYQKALDIQKALLPSYHPDLAKTYRCIAMSYEKAGKLKESLQYYEIVTDIQKKSLPPNHPDLAVSYGNLGEVYRNMGDYEQALLYGQQSLDMMEKSLSTMDPELANASSAIGKVYLQLGDFSKALSSYEKALEIQKKYFPQDHPDIAASFMNMGNVYSCQGDYSKALSCYEKGLEIEQKVLPPTHENLVACYYNLGELHHQLAEYPTALSSLQQCLTCLDMMGNVKTILHGFPYCCLGKVYQSMKDYEKALDFYQKAIEIREQLLPPNHPDLAITYSSIGDLYRLMGQFDLAMSFHQKAIHIQEDNSGNPLNVATIYNNMGETLRHMNDQSSALIWFQKAFDIREKRLPKDHLDLATIHHSLSQVFHALGEYRLATEHINCAIDIARQKLADDHPYLVNYLKTFESISSS